MEAGESNYARVLKTNNLLETLAARNARTSRSAVRPHTIHTQPNGDTWLTLESARSSAPITLICIGRPSHKPVVRYKGFLYQAASWSKARRVVAKVEFHAGELFPRVGFIVTNLGTDNRAVVRFYNKRGTAEQWIKEGKQAVKMTRLSCHHFRSNEVRFWLSVLAYNLGNLWRRLVLPKRIEHWSLTSLQLRLVKTGGRLVKHARQILLAAAGGKPAHAAAVWKHAAKDCGVTITSRIGEPQTETDFSAKRN